MTYPELPTLWDTCQVQSVDWLYESLFDCGVSRALLNAVYEDETLIRALWLYVMTEASHA
jgi:hypothetical protein